MASGRDMGPLSYSFTDRSPQFSAFPIYSRLFVDDNMHTDTQLEWYIMTGPGQVQIIHTVCLAATQRARHARRIQTAFRLHLARKLRARRLALAMALQPRLGQDCGLACLGEDLLCLLLRSQAVV